MKQPDQDPDKTLPPVAPGPNETMPFPSGMSFDDILEGIRRQDAEMTQYFERALGGLFSKEVHVLKLSYNFASEVFDVKFEVAGQAKHMEIGTEETPAH